MELQRRLAKGFQISKPYLFLTLNELALSVFLVLVESLASSGISTLVIVVYEHVLATIVLSLLSFFFEKNNRPPITFKILCYAFLMGLLQVTLCQMLMTMALQYISSTYESIALNMVPTITFVLALIFHQEKVRFRSINGQAKIWGLGISLGGALALVLWKGPVVVKAMLSISFDTTSDSVLGWIMTIVGVLATSFWNILVRHVIQIYPAEISLTAMMSFFGTIQTAIVAAFVVSSSAWELQWDGGLVLITLLLGGIVVTGLSYYVMTWSIGIKGPVFSASFNPLLVLFSFLLNTFVLGSSAHLGSIVGAVLVIVGLYLLLWAKANDVEKKDMDVGDPTCSPLIQP
ncbi:hypothetical protein PVL29_014868 [Vitis rotundifolia]|uniref:WAT1-related protein n=1 Tax=Vitis rotundifolia TaxID=103349 RepID=A0AA38ZIE0_VITRO|nr:hypothetical protein PVL29_014868 [Vitis rotundifolia]